MLSDNRENKPYDDVRQLGILRKKPQSTALFESSESLSERADPASVVLVGSHLFDRID
jgi:hypothetical protein